MYTAIIIILSSRTDYKVKFQEGSHPAGKGCSLCARWVILAHPPLNTMRPYWSAFLTNSSSVRLLMPHRAGRAQWHCPSELLCFSRHRPTARSFHKKTRFHLLKTLKKNKIKPKILCLWHYDFRVHPTASLDLAALLKVCEEWIHSLQLCDYDALR